MNSPFVKGQRENIFGFIGHKTCCFMIATIVAISVATIQLCHCGTKAAISHT